jgi:diguanylate cyclase (GGDEF)-like protein
MFRMRSIFAGMRAGFLIGLALGVLLLALAFVAAHAELRSDRARVEQRLRGAAEERSLRLTQFLERAGTGMRTLAGVPDLAHLAGGDESARTRAEAAFRAFVRQNPGVAAEVGFTNDEDEETIALDGQGRSTPDELDDRRENEDVEIARRLPNWAVRAADPYLEDDIGTWVMPLTATVRARERVGVLHAALTLEPIAEELGVDDEIALYVIDSDETSHGTVLFDEHGIALNRPRMPVPDASSGALDVAGRPGVFVQATARELGDEAWAVLAVSKRPIGGLLDHFGLLSTVLALLGAMLTVLSVVGSQLSTRSLHMAATTDALTGLKNRRKLLEDLEADFDQPRVLAFFDLNGFKGYNDLFGHAAGDELLKRLGSRLQSSAAPFAEAYRLGGDEFCVLTPANEADDVLQATLAALRERGPQFEVTASMGVVTLPDEAPTVSDALVLADRRMYADKGGSRRDTAGQVRDALIAALNESHPDLEEHVQDVGNLALQVGEALGLGPVELSDVLHAADLHDIGKVAIPDAILNKPGPLNEDEMAFMRRHTVIGERILANAPMLKNVAKIVRASHERWDGGGYPDGTAGSDIPLGARIIFACDAYSAMTADRVYRRSLAELRRGAGTQFDPTVIDVLIGILEKQASPAPARQPEAPLFAAGAG